MNLSKRNFKLSKRTVFLFKKQLGVNGYMISSDPVGTVYGPTTVNTIVPKHNA